MISNIFAMPGSPASISDEVARAMAREAMDLATRSQPGALSVPWLDAADLVTGVATTSGGAATWANGAVVTDGGGVNGSDLSIADITTAAALFTYTVTGSVTYLIGAPPAIQGPPHVGVAGIGYRIFTYYQARMAQIVANGPALGAGDKIFLRFPAIKGADGAAAEGFGTSIALADGGPGDRWFFDLADGSVIFGSSDDISSSLDDPTVEFSDNGDGSAEITLTWVAAASVAAGWKIGISSYDSLDQQGHGIEFDGYQVTVGDTSPHGTGDVPGGYGLVVADPEVGSHRATLPFVLALTAAKPASDGTVMEISGTTGGQAGDLVATVVVASGKPQLQVSEDGGATTLTATVPAGAWSTSVVAEVAVRIAGQDVELFIAGRRKTALRLAATPTAIDTYAVASTVAGTAVAAMTISAALDADGLVIEGDDPPMMTQTEYDALALKPSAVDIVQ